MNQIKINPDDKLIFLYGLSAHKDLIDPITNSLYHKEIEVYHGQLEFIAEAHVKGAELWHLEKISGQEYPGLVLTGIESQILRGGLFRINGDYDFYMENSDIFNRCKWTSETYFIDECPDDTLFFRCKTPVFYGDHGQSSIAIAEVYVFNNRSRYLFGRENKFARTERLQCENWADYILSKRQDWSDQQILMAVYGSLSRVDGRLPPHFEEHGVTGDQFKPLGKTAKVRGRLYTIQNTKTEQVYPALKLDKESPYLIECELFKVKDLETTLLSLDAYEHYDPDYFSPLESLYIRQTLRADVTGEDQKYYVTIYPFNFECGMFKSSEIGAESQNAQFDWYVFPDQDTPEVMPKEGSHLIRWSDVLEKLVQIPPMEEEHSGEEVSSKSS